VLDTSLLCRPFCIFERCMNSNPERLRGKQTRYQLNHPSPFYYSVCIVYIWNGSYAYYAYTLKSNNRGPYSTVLSRRLLRRQHSTYSINIDVLLKKKLFCLDQQKKFPNPTFFSTNFETPTTQDRLAKKSWLRILYCTLQYSTVHIPELGRSRDPSRGIDPGPRTWPPVPARYR